jgi:hypothetical protein
MEPKKVKERLPTEYFEETEKFLNAFRKECAKKLNRRGIEADPISWGLVSSESFSDGPFLKVLFLCGYFHLYSWVAWQKIN